MLYAGQNDHKFITADAHHRIFFTDGLFKAVSHHTQ